MDQKELNELFKPVSQADDYDKAYEEYVKKIEEFGKIISFDWKASGDKIIEEFEKALKKFGIKILEEPSTKGTDQYGIVLIHEDWQ